MLLPEGALLCVARLAQRCGCVVVSPGRQAYLFMFFGVSLIYTDLLELQPVGAVAADLPAVENSDVPPPMTAAAAIATARPSRSPFALVIFAAALLMTLGLFCGFVFTMAPIAAGLFKDLSVSSLLRVDVLPWVLVASLVSVLYYEERKARQLAVSASQALRLNDLDNARLESYPAKCVHHVVWQYCFHW
jgi:hypothetical protein